MELAQLNWPDAGDALRRVRVALLPVGSMEQHGPHLPLGTDWYIASHIARNVAESDDRLVLPGIQVGVSDEHSQFWGTLTVSPEALKGQAVALARSLASHGLERIVFVNGHGANCAPLEEATRSLRQENVSGFVFNWWQSVTSTTAELFPDPTAHAGSIETSIMLVIHPGLVRTDRFDEADPADRWGTYVEGVLVGFDAVDFTRQGNVGDPGLADEAKGRQVIRAACDSLDRFCTWLDARSDEELARRPHVP